MAMSRTTHRRESAPYGRVDATKWYEATDSVAPLLFHSNRLVECASPHFDIVWRLRSYVDALVFTRAQFLHASIESRRRSESGRTKQLDGARTHALEHVQRRREI